MLYLIGSPAATAERIRALDVTRLLLAEIDLAGKRIELLREIVSGLGRLAVLANVGISSAALEMAEAEAAASALGFQVTTLGIRSAEEIAPALETLKGRAHALYVVIDPLLGANRIRIHTLTDRKSVV